MLLEEGVSEKQHRDLLSAVVQRIVGTAAESLQYVGEVSTVRKVSDDGCWRISLLHPFTENQDIYF